MQIVNWIRAQLLELFVLCGIGVWRLATLFRKEQGAALHLRSRPILLVHGYLNGSFVWDLHKKRLLQKSIGPIYTIDLGYPFHSIRKYAASVQKKAFEIAKETGRSDLTLIGHSMGGLVITYYVALLASHPVAQVITVGSPLKGTHVAKIGLGRCAREMEIDSPFLQELNSAIEKCSRNVSFYHIATKTDQLVIPYHSALLTDRPHFVFDNIGHSSLLVSKRVTDKISDWLQEEYK